VARGTEESLLSWVHTYRSLVQEEAFGEFGRFTGRAQKAAYFELKLFELSGTFYSEVAGNADKRKDIGALWRLRANETYQETKAFLDSNIDQLRNTKSM